MKQRMPLYDDVNHDRNNAKLQVSLPSIFTNNDGFLNSLPVVNEGSNAKPYFTANEIRNERINEEIQFE
jgi:hypothetical protein